MIQEKFVVDLYIRVSTDRQAKEGDSLEEQENELKKFCEYRNYQIHNIYIEKGKSGGNTNRPEYKNLIKDIKAKKIQAVVVKKIDRLSRSLLDFEAFMNLLQEQEIEFISIKENFDTTNAMGKAMLRVALVFAQLEREQTSERVLDVMTHRAEQGLFNGGIPAYGYTNSNKELIPYPKERKIIELIFEQFINTKSTTQTARLLNETGYTYRNNRLWDKRWVQRILKNPIYTGKVFWKGELYQGIHQPIISEKRFSKVQYIFSERCRIRSNSKTQALLQQLIFCGDCKSLMTPSHGTSKNKARYYYYRCIKLKSSEKNISKPTSALCKIRNVSFKEIDNKVINTILALVGKDHFALMENRVSKHNSAIDQEAEAINLEIAVLKNQQQAISQKRDHYLDSLMQGGFTSSEREKINRRIDELELEEKKIKASVYKQEFEKSQKQDEQISLTNLKICLIDFSASYETMGIEQIREFLIKHVERVDYYPQKLVIKFRIMSWGLDFNT
jgi:site-specific DNA recombinase